MKGLIYMDTPEIKFITEDVTKDDYYNLLDKLKLEKDSYIILRKTIYKNYKGEGFIESKYLQIFIQINHLQKMIGMGVFVNDEGEKKYAKESFIGNKEFYFVGNQVYYNNLNKLCLGKPFLDKMNDVTMLDEEKQKKLIDILVRKYDVKSFESMKSYMKSDMYTYRFFKSGLDIENNKIYLIGDEEYNVLEKPLSKKSIRRTESFEKRTKKFYDPIDEPSRRLFINNKFSSQDKIDSKELIDISFSEKDEDHLNEVSEDKERYLQKSKKDKAFEQTKFKSLKNINDFTDLNVLFSAIDNLSIGDKCDVMKQISKLNEKNKYYHGIYLDLVQSSQYYTVLNSVIKADEFYPLYVLIQIIQKSKGNSFVIIDFNNISTKLEDVIKNILFNISDDSDNYKFKTFIYKNNAKGIEEITNE